MIALLDTSDDLREAQIEIGCPVEQLLTPLTRYLPQYPEERFAIDNGAFSNFNQQAFLSLLKREEHRIALCRFVTVPDVVGSALRTLECFDHWYGRICRWPLALACQDGQESLSIPWKSIDAVFIGGTTGWKMSESAKQIIKAAKAIGKWCHVGRVNTPGRFEYFEELGADSIDGTGIARYSWMREKIHRAMNEPRLFQ